MNLGASAVVRHIIGLDMAVGIGCKVQWRGKEWELSPLTFADWGEVISYNKSKALEIYNAVAGQQKQDPYQRIRDINGILLRAPAMEDFFTRDPKGTFIRLKRSLMHKQPGVTDDEVRDMIDDAEFREHVAVLMDVQDFGIGDGKPKEGDDGGLNPTGTPSST